MSPWRHRSKEDQTKWLSLVLLLVPALHPVTAQWVHTTGPTGGITNAITYVSMPAMPTGSVVLAGSTDIYRSTDGGSSWSRVANPQHPAAALSFATVPSADGRRDSLVIAGANGRFLRSSDYGLTWEDIPGAPDYATALLWVPRKGQANTDFLFAGSDIDSLSRSSDNGASWMNLCTSLKYPSQALAVDTNFALNGRVYLFTGGRGNNEVYRSTDFGDHWVEAGAGLPASPVLTLLVVDGCVLAGTEVGVYVSTDKGGSWSADRDGMPETAVHHLSMSSIAGVVQIFAATDQGIFVKSYGTTVWGRIEMDPQPGIVLQVANAGEHLLGATSWGVYRSELTWSSWSSANSGLTTTQMTDVIFLPASKNFPPAMYVASYGGGVFRSLDHGSTWDSVNTGLVDRRVNCLLRSGSTLYAGTSAGGIFRFHPGNLEWTAADSGLPYTEIMSVVGHGGDLFAAALRRGVFRSTDDGLSWSATDTSLGGFYVMTLAASETDIFVGTSGGGVFRSTDRGTHWTPVNTGLSNLDVTRLLRNGSLLYAGTTGGLYVSPNGGTSWTLLSAGLPDAVVTSIFALESRLFVGTGGGRVFTSINGGSTWRLLYDFHASIDVPAVVTSPGLDPNQIDVWACSFGMGVVRTQVAWTKWTPSNAGLTNSSVRCFTAKTGASSSGSMLFAADGGVCRSSDHGWTWFPARSGLSGLTVSSIGSTPPNRNGAPEAIFLGTTDGRVFRSLDDGNSWTGVHPDVPNNGGFGVTSFLFLQRPLPGDGLDLFFAVPGGGISLSTDNGDTWKTMNTGLPVRPSTGVKAIFAMAQIDTLLFAATGDGVYRSFDRGQTWVRSNAGIPDHTNAVCLQVVGSMIFAAAGITENSLYRSTDRGTTWEKVETGLTDMIVEALAAYNGSLFLGNIDGRILMSPDLGAHWTPIDAGLPKPARMLQTLFVDVSSPNVGERYLLAGFDPFPGGPGGGAWRRPLSEILFSLAIGPKSLQFGGVDVGLQKSATVWANNSSMSPVVIEATLQGSDNFHVSPLSTTVFAGGTSSFVVTYQPTTEAHHAGIVLLTCGALGTTDTVLLTGTGVPTAIVTIDSITPHSGPVGTSVTIAGSHFSPVPDSNIVHFGTLRAPVISASPSQMVVTVPPGASIAHLTVTTHGRIAYGSRPFSVTFRSCGRIDTSSFFRSGNLAPNGKTPQFLTSGDLDGDGKVDIVSWSWDTSIVSVYRNISTKGNLTDVSFAPSVDFQIGLISTYLVLADMDGDGKLDIVAGRGPSVLRNTSSPGSITSNSFAPCVVLPGKGGVGSVRDLDGDGKPDIVLVTEEKNAAVLVNNTTPGNIGAGDFGTEIPFALGDGGGPVFTEDMDGDGKPDIISGVADARSIAILKNVSSRGTITPASFSPYVWFGMGSYTTQVSPLDIDGDAKLDLLAKLDFDDVLTIRRNTSVPGEISSSSFGTTLIVLPTLPRPMKMIPGDIDGDGKPDVVLMRKYITPLSVQVFLNRSIPGEITESSFGVHQLAVGENGQYYDMIVEDLDGDGRPDLAMGQSPSPTGGSIALLRNRLGDTYLVRSTSDTNGVIVPAGEVSVLHGTDQAFALVPRSGCKIDSIVVDGTRVDSLETYTFRSVTIGHSIRAFFGRTSAVKSLTDQLPTVFDLRQNYPNPFNPVTNIRFQLPKESHVTIVVYDLLGREVLRLVDGMRPPGVYSTPFTGSGMASGVYICRMTAGDFVGLRKMLLIR